MDETRVAVIHFNNYAYEVVNFDNFENITKVENSIKNISYNGGQRNIADALSEANNRIFQENLGMRPDGLGVPRIILLITTGESINKNETLKESTLLKNRGIQIITLGIFTSGTFTGILTLFKCYYYVKLNATKTQFIFNSYNLYYMKYNF